MKPYLQIAVRGSEGAVPSTWPAFSLYKIVEDLGWLGERVLAFDYRSVSRIAQMGLAHVASPLRPAALCVIILAGCTPRNPAGAPSGSAVSFASQTAVISSFTESLTPDELREVADTTVDGPYRLGATDVISVTVFTHPELDVPTAGSGSQIHGALITSDGTTELPLIGDIALGGLTITQARDAISSAYAKYIVDPKVAVELQDPSSLRYYLLGAFTSPGIKFPVHPLNLLEALALGGSVNLPDADLRQAYVAQGSVKLPVDMYALLVEGDMSQNIPLASGDTVVIPSSSAEDAFVFGAVTKPGAVPFAAGGLTLLQALADAGLDLTSYTNAELSNIHIIRGNGRTAQFLVVNANLILSGSAASFQLQPGDIIFVPPTLVATWNQVLAQLLPSLQVVSDTLNPFVSIKYLERK
jgi:polysaccharide export outer membrane protein